MALSILDGNQSATTLSTILSSGQHITAHTVVSLGTQAITDMRGAVSGSVVSISNLPSTQTIAGTVTANLASVVTINSSGASYSQRVVSKSDLQFTAIAGAIDPTRFSSDYTVLPVKITSETDGLNLAVDLRKTSQGNDLSAISNDATAAFVRTQVVGGSVTIGSLPAISGTVTVGNTVTIAGTVTANPTGTQTIAGSVTLGASTAQIGSVTASISGTVPISISSVTIGNSVTISTLPALVAGTAQIGSVTASISNSVTIGSLPLISGTVTANPAISSTVITFGSFTSLTSAALVPANTARKMATVYNLGAGQLFINAGVTATTLGGGFMVALSSGDFYECPYTTTTLSAIFATAGTASWISH